MISSDPAINIDLEITRDHLKYNDGPYKKCFIEGDPKITLKITGLRVNGQDCQLIADCKSVEYVLEEKTDTIYVADGSIDAEFVKDELNSITTSDVKPEQFWRVT